jgi:CRISPR-associated endonuclease/helicase Cas3
LFFIALHDYGKLDVRFQYKSIDTFKSIWPTFDPRWVNPGQLDSKRYFHGPAGLSWFRADFRQAMGWADREQPERWEEVWRPWLAAVTGHHGVIPDNAEPRHKLSNKQAQEPVHEHDRQARVQWVETLERLFLHSAGLSLQQDPPACPLLLAGFCSVCGSSKRSAPC